MRSATTRRGIFPKTIALSLGGGLLAFYLISVLARQAWFLGGFGFAPGEMAPALLLFALLSGVVTFWVSPLFHGAVAPP